MTEQELAERFLSNSNLYATSRGFRFGSGAAGFFKDAANRAAKDILEKPDVDPDGPLFAVLIRHGDRAFETLIDAMIAGANELPNYLANHPQTIGEETLAFAMSELCPMWPIC